MDRTPRAPTRAASIAATDARAAVVAIEAARAGRPEARALQEYLAASAS